MYQNRRNQLPMVASVMRYISLPRPAGKDGENVLAPNCRRHMTQEPCCCPWLHDPWCARLCTPTSETSLAVLHSICEGVHCLSMRSSHQCQLRIQIFTIWKYSSNTYTDSAPFRKFNIQILKLNIFNVFSFTTFIKNCIKWSTTNFKRKISL